MATGRQLFALFGPIIGLCGVVLRLIPRSLVQSSWWLVSYLPGKVGIGIRYLFAKRLASECKDNVLIGPGVFIDHWENLKIGRNVTIHRHSYLDARGGIRIGDHVSIAHGVSILSFEHSWDDAATPIKYNPLILDPVEIASDVWIGCGVRVLSGAKIESRTVVAAGAVVIRGEYAGGVWGGVPARQLKRLVLATHHEAVLTT